MHRWAESVGFEDEGTVHRTIIAGVHYKKAASLIWLKRLSVT